MNSECCGMKCPQTPPVENTAVYDRFFFISSKPQRKMTGTWATARWTPAPRRGRTSTTSSTCPCGAWPRRRWRSCSNRGTRRSLLFLWLPFFNVFFYCRSFLLFHSSYCGPKNMNKTHSWFCLLEDAFWLTKPIHANVQVAELNDLQKKSPDELWKEDLAVFIEELDVSLQKQRRCFFKPCNRIWTYYTIWR